MGYATVQEVADGFRRLSDEERERCAAMLEEAAILIDACRADVDNERKRLVSCRMVRRVLGDGMGEGAPLYPMGATQGSASALGYSQSWTLSGGSSGELYLSKTEKRLLGAGDRIGAGSSLEVQQYDPWR